MSAEVDDSLGHAVRHQADHGAVVLPHQRRNGLDEAASDGRPLIGPSPEPVASEVPTLQPGVAAVPVVHTLAYVVGLLGCALALLGMRIVTARPVLVLAAGLVLAAVVTLTRADEWVALPRGRVLEVARGVRVILGLSALVLVAVSAGILPHPVLWAIPPVVGVSFGALLAAPALAEAAAFKARRALLVSDNENYGEVAEALELHRHSGVLDIVGTVASSDIVAQGRSLVERCQRERADVVFVAGRQLNPDLVQQIGALQAAGIRVRWQADFMEEFCRLVPLSDLDVRWFLFDVAQLHRRAYRIVSDAFDVAVGVSILLLLALVGPLVALAIRLDGPGSFLFSQERVGRHGRHFRIYKFRTMVTAASARGAACASEGDARVTRVGRLLRRSRLDELPQAWNLVRRDMSLIGPRPERPEFVDLYRREIPFYDFRHILRPGLTGWAQVTEGYISDTAGTRRKLERDLYYVRRQGFRLDLQILRATATSILRLSGR